MIFLRLEDASKQIPYFMVPYLYNLYQSIQNLTPFFWIKKMILYFITILYFKFSFP